MWPAAAAASEPDVRPAPEPSAPESGPRPPQGRSDGPSGPEGARPTPPPPDAIPFEQVRERAYELWERNHRPEGFEIEFWLLAERELRKERALRTSGAAPGSRTP